MLVLPLVAGLLPSSSWSSGGAAPRRAIRSADPRAELTFGSAQEYESWLEAESALPAGFRVATGGFSFVPESARLQDPN